MDEPYLERDHDQARSIPGWGIVVPLEERRRQILEDAHMTGGRLARRISESSMRSTWRAWRPTTILPRTHLRGDYDKPEMLEAPTGDTPRRGSIIRCWGSGRQDKDLCTGDPIKCMSCFVLSCRSYPAPSAFWGGFEVGRSGCRRSSVRHPGFNRRSPAAGERLFVRAREMVRDATATAPHVVGTRQGRR